MMPLANLIFDAVRPRFKKKISKKEFNNWTKDCIFQVLQGQKPGASFCKKFDIDDKILIHVEMNFELTCKYIQQHYVK
jgi:hypothetical protein